MLAFKRSNNLITVHIATAAFLVAFSTAQVHAAALSLDQVPLFTQNSAKANLILAIDDSGSMDSEVLFPTNDGALWWQTAKDSFVESGAVVFNTSGSANSSWKKYTYLFPNGTGSGKRVYSDSTHNHYAIPPLPQFWFARSITYNKMYYNPDVTYLPWVNNGSDTYGNITETSAPSDPSTGTSTKNLVSISEQNDSNERFKVYSGMVLPIDTEYHDGSSWKKVSSSPLTVSSEDEWGFKYYPATYFVSAPDGTTYMVGPSGSTTTGTCSSSSPVAADYITFEANPGTIAGVDALGPDGGCLTAVIITSSIDTYSHNGERTDCASSSVCTYKEEIQNFANWYSYYRKRHLALRAGMGNAFDGINSLRSGIFTINNRTNVTMRDLSNSTDNTAFYDLLYAIDGNSGGTPNREALGHAGSQFERTNAGAPIIEQCQKNFSLLFTDGFSTTSAPSVTDQDNDEGSPYEDSYSNTLADIAMHYYKTNLRSDLTSGEVPVNNGCNIASPDPILDCNTNLHMNTYTVGLGAKGTIFGVSHKETADAYTTPPNWPDVNSARDKTQIDDLYHAAVNGRGEMYSADSADELQTKLKTALVSIQSQLGSSSAVTFNTATLETDSAVYLALFNSANWSGDLKSYELDAFGNISLTESWSAADQLDDGSPSYNSRNIITHNGTSGVPFRWNNLTSGQQADLNVAATGTVDGEDVLNYLRGNRANESAGKLRIRDSILGDIINGSPVYVSTPGLSWPSTAPFPTSTGETYNDFIISSKSSPRTSIVYAGGNDGMLHGFNASTGEEEIAYIPSLLFSANTAEGLHYLADPQYQHRYYVDLSPTVSDVYIDPNGGSTRAWTTVLLGGLRGGGKGLFLLNITDPNDFSESTADAAQLAMWEFTHADLGYTFSKPSIAMMENGRWAAIFGNGYNNTGTGEASLFIVFLDGGIDGTWTDGSASTDLDYMILTTGVGSAATPNGLATPRVLDLDGNGAADRAYAGDLQGNMWAFDLSSSSTNPSWDIAYKSGSTPVPLFVATDSSNNVQPITSRPAVRRHPSKPDTGSNSPSLIVMFGTGKFLESNDMNTTDAQTFYGVWDKGTSNLDRGDLMEQTIGTVTHPTSLEVFRTVTNNKVNYNNKEGWFIGLPASGERQVVDPVLRGTLVFFNTWIPSSNACDAGGYGYLMSVEIEDGSAPNSPVFDTNDDNVVDSTDAVSGNNPAGQGFNNGLPSSSRFLGNKEYIPGTDGSEIKTRDVQDLEGLQTGRLSWQELAP